VPGDNTVMAILRCSILALALLALLPSAARAKVLFQNTGAKAGWDSIGIQHKGKVDEVASPTYKGPTALRMEQTFEGLSGYHSEVRLHEAQGPAGSEAYYGMTFYLPPSWIFHPQNVTFQQWARGDVFASPWVLMYVENDEIRVGGSGGVRGVIAKITGMQGQWIRVVTHLRHDPTNGLFEVWVNGKKGFTQSGAISPNAATPIRWSVGMYCTRWREEQPKGLDPMVLFHDHQRVATTFEEADPEGWSDGASSPLPADAGAPDAARPDAAAPEEVPDAASADAHAPPSPEPPAVDSSVPEAGAGAKPRDAATASRDAAASVPSEGDEVSPVTTSASGCQLARGGEGASSSGPLGLSLLALVGLRIRRARTTGRARGA
jgi:hypothetical protein